MCGNSLDIINIGFDENNELVVTIAECAECAERNKVLT